MAREGLRRVEVLHLQEGAWPDQKPSLPQVLLASPTSMCPSGHVYSITPPTLKLLPLMVVLRFLSGLPQDDGAVKDTEGLFTGLLLTRSLSNHRREYNLR